MHLTMNVNCLEYVFEENILGRIALGNTITEDDKSLKNNSIIE